ncbi:hypothetical protein BKG58_18685 [Mycobacteroides abscessus subsp. abscessus]|nr:hypothetical protein DDT48_13905 [Mycobacteroides abscessus]MBN7551484.1 hypothetical protein [Mycobacteroides abscessus subsp. abscessus]MDM2176058.1 hypothetical protein [Mycobacteroides abscessus]MDM2207044.1 hypothetical protein [Mycobacteroides abscessus]MDM2210138.1 hypothetical protein [Mycobacteroides abscessus]
MSGPFSALPAGKPPSFVVERLDEAISENHARVRILGDTMSGGSEKTRQAMVAVLESAEHEVVVAALLAGTNALMLGYRTVLGPLGESLRGQIDVAQAAWRAYCATGLWERPIRADPPSVMAPQPLMKFADPRPLVGHERITAQYTESVMAAIGDAATNVGKAGVDFFANALRAPVFPGLSGELMDFVDTATLGHAKLFASVQSALAASLQDHIDRTRTSYLDYHRSGCWSEPTVAFV